MYNDPIPGPHLAGVSINLLPQPSINRPPSQASKLLVSKNGGHILEKGGVLRLGVHLFV